MKQFYEAHLDLFLEGMGEPLPVEDDDDEDDDDLLDAA
jgi:hypothetical protein